MAGRAHRRSLAEAAAAAGRRLDTGPAGIRACVSGQTSFYGLSESGARKARSTRSDAAIEPKFAQGAGGEAEREHEYGGE